MRPFRSWLPDLGCCGALVGLALAYYWRFLGWTGSAASFSESDFSNIFWPFHKFNLREWSAGRIPLWDNSFSAGQPHLANPETAVFYPFAIVELLLAGRPDAMSGIYTRLWLDTCVAAVGMYLLVRHLTGRRAPATLAGIAFGLGGITLGWASSQMSYLEGLAWIPLCLFFLDRAFDRDRSLGNAWLAGWSIAPIFLGGYPQMWFLLPWAVIATILGHRARHAVSWRRSLLVLVLLTVSALSLAAIQLVPALEFVLNSSRSVHLGWGRGYLWEGFFPQLARDLVGFVGYLPLALAPMALVLRGRRGLAAVWLAVALFGVLLALGDTTPFYEVSSRLGFGLFRGQTRNLVLTMLALCILAGLGLAAAQERFPELRRLGPLFCLAAAANLLLAGWDINTPIPQRIAPNIGGFPRIVAALREARAAERTRFVIDREPWYFSPQEASAYDLEHVNTILNLHLKAPYELLSTQAFFRQWQLFNVHHIVAQRPLSGEAIKPLLTEGSATLYEVLYSLPRAYVVWDARVVESSEAALRAVLDGSFDPGASVVLERPSSRPLVRPASPTQQVSVDHVDPQQTRISVTIPVDGVLVVSQPFYPGWKAELDGRPLEIWPANLAFMAFPVPAGAHTVRLTYQPESFRLGAAITTASVVGSILWFGFASIRRRRRVSA